MQRSNVTQKKKNETKSGFVFLRIFVTSSHVSTVQQEGGVGGVCWPRPVCWPIYMINSLVTLDAFDKSAKTNVHRIVPMESLFSLGIARSNRR